MGKSYSSAAARAKAGTGPIPDNPADIVAWVGKDPERARLAFLHIATWPPAPDEQTQAAWDELVLAIRQVLPWFELDQTRFTCYGNVSLLDLCELAGAAAADMDSPEGMAAVAEFFKAALGNAEYQRFKIHLRRHATSEDIVASIMQDLAEEFTARPTGRPSQSLLGPLTTIPTSKVVSPSGQVTEAPMTPEEMASWLENYQAQIQAHNSSAATPAPV